MKRLFIIFVLTLFFGTLMAQPAWDGTIANSFNSGNGDEDKPYLITTADELAYLATQVKDGTNYAGKYFRLENDLDLGNRAWTPIGGGDSFRTFNGKFDGNGKIIANLTIAASIVQNANGYGLFGAITSGEVSRLGIIGEGKIEAPSPVGSICGKIINGKITSCFNAGSTVKVAWANNGGGGIVGNASGSTCFITDCYNTKFMDHFKTDRYLGGVVGCLISSATVKNCYNIGSIATGSWRGAITGQMVGSSSNNYYDKVLVYSQNGSGTGKTTEEMKSAGMITLLGEGYMQDIANTINNGYPALSWQKVIAVVNYQITITQNSNGIITVKNGDTAVNSGGSLPKGTELDLEATSNQGYLFLEWWDGNTEPERTLTLESDITISATFVPIPTEQYAIAIGTPQNGTIIVKNGDKTINNGDKLSYGTVLTVEAIANQGYRFAKWVNGNKNRVFTHTVTGAISFMTTFEAMPPEPNIWAGTVASAFGGGAGLETNPYYIDTPEQLAFLAKSVNDGTNYENTYFQLTYDLDLNKINWTPIGNGVKFAGKFDGNGKTVANVYLYKYEAIDQGLFGIIDGGEIKNLGVVGTSEFMSKHSVGGICGNLKSGKISNCFNSGVQVKSLTTYYDSSAGGIVGTLGTGTIENCYNTATVNSLVEAAAHGGIVGIITGGSTVKNCYSVGALSNGSSAGGVIGRNIVESGFTFTNNFYNVDICGSANNIGAVAKTTVEMKNQNFLTTLGSAYKADFTDVKQLNKGYPILSWQTEPKLFDITIQQPSIGGTVAATLDGVAVTSGKIKLGAVLKLSATSAANYKFSNFIINGNNFSGNEYMVRDNTIITALFIAKQKIGINITNTTHTYDGTAKTIQYTTNPQDLVCNVEYTMNELPVIAPTDAGSYNVKLTRNEDSQYASVSEAAVMTINKADITGITFEDIELTYDGTEKSILISGPLPEGTAVQYQNNTGTSIGTYDAIATISGSNYNTLTLYATMTITANPTIEVNVSNLTHVYDGAVKSISYTTNPEGITLEVTYKQNNVTVEPISVGSYDVTLKRDADGTYTTVNKTVTMTITPATITGLTFGNQTYAYDGTMYEILVSGEIPEEGVIEYTDNAAIDVGVYQSTAKITAPNYDNLMLTATLTITQARPDIGIPPTASDVGSGQSLSRSILSGGNATVVGVFSWTNPGQIVTATGQFEATFTPTDSHNYTTATCMVEVRVAPLYTITAATCENGSVQIHNATSDNLYVEGQAITLIATANSGYRLVKWWNESCGSPYSYTVTESLQISATFEPTPALPDPWDGTIASAFGGGDGSANNPYLIYNTSELAYFASLVNNGDYMDGKYILLKNNLNLANREWTPIGGCDRMREFGGVFDGSGHTIANITINLPTTYEVGLFGKISGGAVIKNLGIIGNGSIKGEINVGAFVGNNRGNIQNCYNIGCSVSGKYYVGGIAGRSMDYVIIENCYNRADVTATGADYVGGITATADAKSLVSNCYAACTIKGNRTGAIVASSEGDVINCYHDYEIMSDIVAYKSTGLTTLEMKQGAQLLGEGYKDDFDGPQANDGYPILNWQTLYPGYEIEKLNITVGTPLNGIITVLRNNVPVTGTVVMETGTVLSLSANPNPTYRFVRWWDNNTDQTREFTVMDNTTITAIFEVKPYTEHVITITAPQNGQIVVKNGNVVVNSGDKVAEGATLSLAAEPNSGCRFVRWWDNDINPNRIIVPVDAITISAEFELIPLNTYEITIEPSTNGTISVKNGEQTISTGDIVTEGTVLTLKAEANPNCVFTQWWDSNTEAERTITVTSDITISALFNTVGVEEMIPIDCTIYAYAKVININLSEDIDNAVAKVIDINGRVISTSKIENIEHVIEIQTQGAYIVQVSISNKVIKTQKVIIE